MAIHLTDFEMFHSEMADRPKNISSNSLQYYQIFLNVFNFYISSSLVGLKLITGSTEKILVKS